MGREHRWRRRIGKSVTAELQGQVNKMPEIATKRPIMTPAMTPVSAEGLWAAAQARLRSMLNADTFNLWFAPLRVSSLEKDCIVLEVANDFCEVWLKDNYMGLLQEVLS